MYKLGTSPILFVNTDVLYLICKFLIQIIAFVLPHVFHVKGLRIIIYILIHITYYFTITAYAIINI